MNYKAWDSFVGGNWQEDIDVRDFIQKNYTPYAGEGNFLAKATSRTARLMNKAVSYTHLAC